LHAFVPTVTAAIRYDPGMNLLARSSFGTAEEFRVYNRIARRLMPFLLLLYIISFLDRVNVGFAKLQMAGDIGLSDAAYGLGAGIFFIGYSLFEIPSNLLLQRFGARFWIARILVIWGLISTCMMLVQTPLQFYGMRLLLGIAEAGFYPGVILYLTYWFPVRLRSQICAIFLLGIAISGVIGGPLSGWIMSSFGGLAGLRGWQWLFLVEGTPAILFGFVTYFYLDDRPAEATWLAEAERSLVSEELEREHQLRLGAGMGHRFGHAMRSGKLWLLILVNFSLISAVYGVSFWLPQMIHDLGFKDLLVDGIVSAIPFAVACTAMIVIGQHSDRSGERKWHIVLSGLLGAAGLCLSGIFTTTPSISLIGVSLAMAGALAGVSVIWSLPGAILSGTAAAAGFALMGTISNMGGYVMPFALGHIKETTGRLEYGFYGMAVFIIVGSLLMSLLAPARTLSAESKHAAAASAR